MELGVLTGPALAQTQVYRRKRTGKEEGGLFICVCSKKAAADVQSINRVRLGTREKIQPPGGDESFSLARKEHLIISHQNQGLCSRDRHFVK